jgi:hypothetical protein
MVQRGEQVPHFTVRTMDGMRVNYSEIWQRRNLLLVCLLAEASDDSSRSYVSELNSRAVEIRQQDAEHVITTECISGLPCPGVVVADRWGEIYFVAAGATVGRLPGPDELLAWLQHIKYECPECQGEAR